MISILAIKQTENDAARAKLRDEIRKKLEEIQLNFYFFSTNAHGKDLVFFNDRISRKKNLN